ncbi:hypothetical protein T08_7238 [Trichinella sp. T8]|nr:hypothetical protein T08_7238 [Trichinella sp. T8]
MKGTYQINDRACNLEFLVVAMKNECWKNGVVAVVLGQPSRGPASKGIEFGLQSAMAPTVVGGSDEKRRLLSTVKKPLNTYLPSRLIKQRP